MMSSLDGNLWEQNLQRSADFGHSVSQVLEDLHPTSITHGEAVAVDMALSLEVARSRGIAKAADVDRVLHLIKSVGLPVFRTDVAPEDILAALDETQRHRGGRQRLPLMRAIGGTPVFVDDVNPGEVRAAWLSLWREGNQS